MKLWVKVLLSIVGTIAVTGTSYLTAHQESWTTIGLVTAVGGPIGSYILGLVQNGPGQGGQ